MCTKAGKWEDFDIRFCIQRHNLLSASARKGSPADNSRKRTGSQSSPIRSDSSPVLSEAASWLRSGSAGGCFLDERSRKSEMFVSCGCSHRSVATVAEDEVVWLVSRITCKPVCQDFFTSHASSLFIVKAMIRSTFSPQINVTSSYV
jgi:hypothetical protein